MTTEATNAMQAQLDRLVGGDLAENDRRSLLAWLDEDASRWRACAVAFLEAQNWEAAAKDWPGLAGEAVSGQEPTVQKSPATRDGLWRQILAAAVAVLLFG